MLDNILDPTGTRNGVRDFDKSLGDILSGGSTETTSTSESRKGSSWSCEESINFSTTLSKGESKKRCTLSKEFAVSMSIGPGPGVDTS